MSGIATTYTTRRANAIDTFLRTVGFTLTRHPFLFITRITTAGTRCYTLAMLTVEVTHGVALIRIVGILFVAHEAATSVGSGTGAMYTRLATNRYTMVK